MISSSKFSLGERRQVLADWCSCLPGLAPAPNNCVSKRYGPLLIGIALVYGTRYTTYRPTFFVHNLIKPFPAITLTLWHHAPYSRELGTEREVSPSRHHACHVNNAKYFSNQFPELLASALSFSDLVNVYLRSITQFNPCSRTVDIRNQLQDILLISSWFNCQDYKRQVVFDLDGIRRELSWGADLDTWVKEVSALSESEEQMRNTVNREIEKHRLGKVPEFPIQGVGMPIRFISAWKLCWS
jgi:hypothetical protein